MPLLRLTRTVGIALGLAGCAAPLGDRPIPTDHACDLPSAPAVADIDPDAGPQALYADDALPLFDVLLDDDGWTDLCSSAKEYADYLWAIGEDLAPVEVPQRYTRADLVFQGELYEDVGVRFRGRTTLYSLFYTPFDNLRPDGLERCLQELPLRKPSWKIKLDAFGRDWAIAGQQVLNLAAREGSDGAYLREVLATKVANEFGVVAAWAGHARLCVDGAYEGLFSLVQEADKGRFLRQRFDDPTGGYWKVETGGDQAWRPEWDDDAGWLGDYRPVAGTPDEAPGALRDLLVWGRDAAAGVASTAPPIDREQWLRQIAVDLVIPDYDGMFGNHKNHLLYAHPTAGFQVVPYDKDLAFVDLKDYLGGACPGDIHGGHPCWSRVQEPPAVAAWLLEHHRDEYDTTVQRLIDEVLVPERVEGWLLDRAEAMRPWLQADRYYQPDSPACHEAPLTCNYYNPGAWEYEVAPLLTTAVADRVAEVQRQLDGGETCAEACAESGDALAGVAPPVRARN